MLKTKFIPETCLVVINKTHQQKAIFLDRDGVINYDSAYVSRAQDFQFIPGVFAACRQLMQLGYQIIIITNQSGIARGYYSETDFAQLNQWMLNQFEKHDVSIKDVYYCPHHPLHGQGKYKLDCDCRKPQTGMIKQAQQEHNIDLQQSVLAGDKLSDIQAGKRAGIAANFLVKTGKVVTDECAAQADGSFADLLSLSTALSNSPVTDNV